MQRSYTPVADILWLDMHSYDALHGVAGVYAKQIFVEELGAKESSLLNCTPLVMPLMYYLLEFLVPVQVI